MKDWPESGTHGGHRSSPEKLSQEIKTTVPGTVFDVLAVASRAEGCLLERAHSIDMIHAWELRHR